jgi:hypothetical protein
MRTTCSSSGDGFLPDGRIYVSYEGVEFVRWNAPNFHRFLCDVSSVSEDLGFLRIGT